MRVNSFFHVTGCLDVIALINVAPNVALQGGGSAVTYVFPSLGLTEVITSYADTNALSKAWKTNKKKCAVITACIVRFQDHVRTMFGISKLWPLSSLRVLVPYATYWRNDGLDKKSRKWSTLTASKRHLVIPGGSIETADVSAPPRNSSDPDDVHVKESEWRSLGSELQSLCWKRKKPYLGHFYLLHQFGIITV